MMKNKSLNLCLALITLTISVIYYVLEEVNLKALCTYTNPVIFGDDQCSNVNNDQVQLKDKGFINSVLYYLSPKIALRAELFNDSIYVKKLATRNAEEFADVLFVSTFKNVELNQMAIPLVKIEILKIIINHEPTEYYYNGIQKMLFCPKLNKIDQLLVHVPNFNFTDVLSYMKVWSATLLNAEPLVLQIIQPPFWPVPKYYGSCGRVIMVEDCGRPLVAFSNHSWKVRTDLAVQLLNIALKFTFSHPNLGFYFTDPSPDNIAVDDSGKVRFIDLEHVIIVEKHPPLAEQLPNWHVNHTSSHAPCEDCYKIHTEEICSHQISDFNVLSICREILHRTSLLLPGGLLKGGNYRIDKLEPLLDDCVENASGRSRFEVAEELIHLLGGVVSL